MAYGVLGFPWIAWAASSHFRYHKKISHASGYEQRATLCSHTMIVTAGSHQRLMRSLSFEHLHQGKIVQSDLRFKLSCLCHFMYANLNLCTYHRPQDICNIQPCAVRRYSCCTTIWEAPELCLHQCDDDDLVLYSNLPPDPGSLFDTSRSLHSRRFHSSPLDQGLS